ncbi:MAG: hypothetical protein ACI8W8_001559 [Rhodothermales bacterium]|jgi:hypothetical protein
MRYLILTALAFGLCAEDVDSHTLVTFDQLAALEFTLSTAIATTEEERQTRFKEAIDQIPDDIKALNDKTIRIDGYMYPIKLRRGRAAIFLLMRDLQTCGFGRSPRLNEIIYVKMSEPADFEKNEPVTVYGTFSIADGLEADKAGSAVYRLSGTKVILSKLRQDHNAPTHKGAP